MVACALSAASHPAHAYEEEKCEDKWVTSQQGSGEGAKVVIQINCATESKRIAMQSTDARGRRQVAVQEVIAEAIVGQNAVLVSKDREKGSVSVYRMGIKPGGNRNQVYIWKYRLDKDRTPRRVLQNTEPLTEDYRRVGSIRERGGEVIVAARTVGGKEYPAVFFVKNASRGEAMVFRTEIGDALRVRRVPGAPTFEDETTFAPGETKWIPR